MSDPAPVKTQPRELEQLMQRYQSADADAAAALIARISPQMLQFFWADVRNRPEAEDLLQDFWLRIHRVRHTFRTNEPLLPWMYAIARRVRVDHYRRSKRIHTRELQSEILPDVAAQPAEQSDANLEELLKELPTAQRETILMLKGAGLTLEEVARASGSTIGAVKQRAHRAYEKLRKVLGPVE